MKLSIARLSQHPTLEMIHLALAMLWSFFETTTITTTTTTTTTIRYCSRTNPI